MQETKSINPSRKSPINISYEAITPTRAKLWVKNTRETEYIQRKISSGAVAKLSGEMTRGDWHSNTADVIRIANHNGCEVVLDGQHRLSAIIASDKPQDMFVARNVPADAFKYIDQGNSRTLKDVMDCDGWVDSTTMSSIGRYLWVYSESGSPFGQVRDEKKLSAGSLYDWVCEYEPSIREAWNQYSPLIKDAKKGIKMSEAVMGFLFLKLNRVDPLLCHEVFAFFKDPMVSDSCPSINFKLAAKEIQELQFELKSLKARGMSTRSDEHRDLSTMYILFAWVSTVEGRKFKTTTGFRKAFNKYSETGANLWECLG
jgi:hypothetical protein